MQSARANAIYTAFATLVFTGIQYLQDERDPMVLAVTAAMFFFFTFFMLRLISRVMMVVTQGLGKRRPARGARDQDERGPEQVQATTTRPDHVRRRRERRRRR